MTVDELKVRMSAEELGRWMQYVAINGPLHATVRIEHAIARAAAPFLKAKPADLAPWPRAPEREATIDDLMNVLRAAKTPKAVDSAERKLSVEGVCAG